MWARAKVLGMSRVSPPFTRVLACLGDGARRRALWTLLFVLTFVAALLSTAGAQAETKIVYGLHQNKPLNFKDEDGAAKGLVIDVFKHVARQEGWRIEYKPCNWADCLSWLESGEIDVLSAIGHTQKRQALYDFTETPLITNWGLVMTQASTDIHSLLDLEGKTIALMKRAGHSKVLIELLDNFSVKYTALDVDSFKEVLQAVHDKRADAGVVNRLFSSQFAKDYDVLESPVIFNPIEIRYAFTKGKHGALISILDRHLKAQKASKDSLYYSSLAKWFGEGETVQIAQWLKWLAVGSLAAVGVLLLVTKVLREKVATKTLESDALFKVIVKRGPVAFFISDADTDELLFANARAKAMFGIDVGKAAKQTRVADFFEDIQDRLFIWSNLEGSDPLRDVEVRMKRQDGTAFWCSISVARMPFQGQSTIATSIIDITERKRIEAERAAYEEMLLKQANYDEITGLPNRLLFNDRLSQAIKHAERNRAKAGLLFIDLDKFKRVNDTLGHQVGDDLLKMAAMRLLECVRAEDTVARFGGDEFAVVISGVKEPADVRQVADKISASFHRSFMLNETEVFTTASIGICLYPDNGETVEQLMKNADAAMYRAKEQTPGRWCFYTQAINEELQTRLELETQLRKAVENEEFRLEYHPIVETGSGRIASAEALLRWDSPKFGLVQPNDFIGAAEETGLIVPLGKWVLETACRTAKSWEDHYDDPSDAPAISINVSPRQLREPDFVDMLTDIFTRNAISPDRIDIEITENLLMENTDTALDVLKRLHALGIHISMDDFGTGYSSLSYLKRFPLSVLKIDQSFVSDLGSDRGDETLVRAIISMAHDLGLRVIAEGVEAKSHESFLKDKDCDYLQGFLFSEPVADTVFAAMLKEQSTRT